MSEPEDRPLSYPDLSTRALNVLKRAGITTLNKLISKKRTDLMDINGIGDALSDEIADFIRHLK